MIPFVFVFINPSSQSLVPLAFDENEPRLDESSFVLRDPGIGEEEAPRSRSLLLLLLLLLGPRSFFAFATPPLGLDAAEPRSFELDDFFGLFVPAAVVELPPAPPPPPPPPPDPEPLAPLVEEDDPVRISSNRGGRGRICVRS
jgi:hypothetical protein